MQRPLQLWRWGALPTLRVLRVVLQGPAPWALQAWTLALPEAQELELVQRPQPRPRQRLARQRRLVQVLLLLLRAWASRQ